MKPINQTKWKKLGQLYQSHGEELWRVSHASCPLAQHLGGNIYRVWFAARDNNNRTNCTWLDFDITQPNSVVRHAPAPSLTHGGLAQFDERGAMFSWLLEHDGIEYIYYTGWNMGDSVPFRNAIGLATSPAGADSFTKVEGPVLDRSPANPFFVGNPCVVIDHHSTWHLWYLTGTAWHPREDAPPYSDYNIRHATSTNGVDWTISKSVCVDYAHENEMAIARPSVRYWDSTFHMWYSYRGTDFPYRLGYAISDNGVDWERKDDLIDFPRSDIGWDSEMICYPYVFRHIDETYLLYCGNGFSQGGIGLAILDT